MIRATTGGVLRSYRKNLMNSFINQNKARDTVLTQRTFNSYAEDPASAAKAFRLRKSRMAVENQYDVCSETFHKFQGAYQCLQNVDEVLDTENKGNQLNTLKSTTLKMLNDPTGDARTQLKTALDQMSEAIVQTLNQKYGDTFIFAGADGHNVPFEIKENKLYYRGVPVDAAVPDVLMDGNNFVPVTENGRYAGAGAAPTAYLKTDNIEPISISSYEDTYVPPEVEQDFIPNPPFADQYGPVEYNADGTLKGEDDAGGYYKITDANWQGTPNLSNVDGAGTNLISVEKYNRLNNNALNKPQLLQNTDYTLTEVNKDGVPTAGGGFYLAIEGDLKDQVITKAQYETAVEDTAKLKTLMNEKQFVDIGLGMQENEKSQLIESSAYNAALHGLTFLGYGVDEDGDPKNIYSIVQRLKEMAGSVPDGTDWSTPFYEEFRGLVGKLETASSEFKTEFTNMAAGTTKLQTNLKLLEDQHYNLQEQYAELEDVNAAEAITSFIWAQYCYNAALKVGNNILSETLMDYLN